MKNIKYLLLAAVAVMTAFITNSCTDANDWEQDETFDRIFTPSSVSASSLSDEEVAAVEAEGINAKSCKKISWTTYDKGDYYVVQICTQGVWEEIDPVTEKKKYRYEWIDTDAVEDCTNGQSFGDDKSITQTSVILKNLSDGDYRLRVKACSTQGRGESHFVYYENPNNDNRFNIGGSIEEE